MKKKSTYRIRPEKKEFWQIKIPNRFKGCNTPEEMITVLKNENFKEIYSSKKRHKNF
jgi:hypothetical protein